MFVKIILRSFYPFEVTTYAITTRKKVRDLVSTDANWMKEASRAGQIFLCNPYERPAISLEELRRKRIPKYVGRRASESHSPRILNIQCIFIFPKLIRISVMEECEGTSTAISILLSRFKTLPKVCYYDDNCNLAKSVILRTPWVNDECLIASDRFHYRGHKCNTVCDPDSYSLSRLHSTSSAESINQQCNFSKSHIRFIRKDNFMLFFPIKAIHINIRAVIRDKRGTQDIDDAPF